MHLAHWKGHGLKSTTAICLCMSNVCILDRAVLCAAVQVLLERRYGLALVTWVSSETHTAQARDGWLTNQGSSSSSRSCTLMAAA